MSVLSLWPQVVDVRRTRRFLDGSSPFVLKETLFLDHRRRMFDDFTCVWRLHFLLPIRVSTRDQCGVFTCRDTDADRLLMLTLCSRPSARFFARLLNTSASLLPSSLYLSSRSLNTGNGVTNAPFGSNLHQERKDV